MKALKDRILQDGKCFEGGILKVDNFINHQMDPILMKSMAVEFVRRFASTKINKVMTIEASGIAPAIMVGYLLELPVVFVKKKVPVTMENMLKTQVYSFTKDRMYDVCVSKDFLCKDDKVLFIDDFLANGNGRYGIPHRKSLPRRWRMATQRRHSCRIIGHHRESRQLSNQI